MKSLRKSLNSNKDSLRSQISTPLPSVSKPPASILPPQKVIRALSAHKPQAPQELSFQKGDFFYVLRDVDAQGEYYEAHNPVSGARGLVPRAMFEEFNKSNAACVVLVLHIPLIDHRTECLSYSTRTSQANFPTQLPPQTLPLKPIQPDASKPAKPKANIFYAVVLHDFSAERPDELDAKRGDMISVVAQSNREWFVAKPIGKLGRPGLIPVSFVEVRDPTSGSVIIDINALMDSGDLPKVEDWKRSVLNYKQNSIALGVIDTPNRDSVANSPYMPRSPIPSEDSTVVGHDSSTQVSKFSTISSYVSSDSQQPKPLPPLSESFPDGLLVTANVVSFHYEMEDYWFRIDATFQPYGSSGLRNLPPAKQLILFRVYNDFYDFQVNLLKTFPREAGRQPPHPRMLPYMPGPAENVDQEITASRRVELNEYLNKLCELSSVGAKYILESEVVREFLMLKPGDVENDTEPRTRELETIFSLSGEDQFGEEEYANEARDLLGRLKVDEREYDEKSEGSEYEDEGYAPSPPESKQYDRHPYGQQTNWEDRPSSQALRHQAHAQNHQRNESPSPSRYPRSSSLSQSRSNSPLPGTNNGNGYYSTSTSSLRSSQHSSLTGRARSQSSATANLNAPAISAANPQTAFVKIKVFDRLADETIAIRVHPRVTRSELMEKVQARLGAEVSMLRYRDSLNNDLVHVDTDGDLRAWIDGTDKHVLFAD
ncbi:hypothetical protein HGRIS_009251 [Hohenbuehelia grisea]|uniref:Uncharacterized protein n=1 Tax=Hohenbuehelia grisea TaxID=104357 RepID=A0ABR3J0J8_9AGAR